MSNFFHNHCNITDCTYKGVGGWEARGGLHLPTGLFGVAMSPRSASHRPRHNWRALRDVSPTQGWISDPYLPSSALYGSHCLSRDFTRSANPALEKQTSQLSPVMQQCMDSVWVWLLAGPIKCNWPSVTLWSVFQYLEVYRYGNFWLYRYRLYFCQNLPIPITDPILIMHMSSNASWYKPYT